MLRKTVQDLYSGDWKSSVTIGRQSGYGGQTVHETKRNADAFETLLDGEVRQRGMTRPGHEDICKPVTTARTTVYNYNHKNVNTTS